MDPKGLDQLQRQLLLDRVDTIEREKLVHLFETKSTGNRTEIVQRYVQHISQASEAASSQSINLGRQIYQKNCQGCHARNGQGNRVGPDLTAVAGRSPQDILMDILDPNRSVSEDGISYAVLTDDERILTGIIASESSTSVSLKQAGGSIETVLRSDIQEWKRLGKSLMPEGFDDSITPEEMSSLILFLKSPTAE
jgi:putative heme-binding domain-containing protein